MELDSLKDIWKNLDEADLQPGREVPILSMLQKRSQSTIARLKRNLNRELIAVVVIYSITIFIHYEKEQATSNVNGSAAIGGGQV